MLFTEPSFLFLFLPLLLWLYALSPRCCRNLLLAGASFLFYALGEKEYASLLLLSILLNYVVGRGLSPDRSHRARKRSLIAGMVGNLCLLAVFKYGSLLVESINYFLIKVGVDPLATPVIHLPIGISFFTFQSMSYLIDAYRGSAPVQRRIGNLGLYIALFPQLIAGPIVRFKQIAEQIEGRIRTIPLFASGVRRFIIGFAKKMLVANCVAYPADQIFGLPAEQLSPTLAWVGLICYALQIYFDFSGYSDMAIGLGRMFGFRFQENFRFPYIARSITDFWRRWHISLSSWFRDYLYIPLGGNRGGLFKTFRNLSVVFLLCGLWHGASWIFAIWGLYQGLFLILERVGLGLKLERLPGAFSHFYTMIIVLFGWVIFRVATGPVPVGVGEMEYLRDYFASLLGRVGSLCRSPAEFIDGYVLVIIAAGVIGSTPIAGLTLRKYAAVRRRLDAMARRRFTVVAHAVGYSFLLGLLLLGSLSMAADTYNPFIYFQF